MEDDETIQVVATDSILAVLMAAGRSVYSWDILVKKIGDKIILDKRDHSPMIDFLSVNETAVDNPNPIVNNNQNQTITPAQMSAALQAEEINTVPKLAREAARVNQNYAQALLEGGKCIDLAEEHPFFGVDEEELNGGNENNGNGDDNNGDGGVPAGSCYRYRKITIPGVKKSDNYIKQSDVVICVRTEINGAEGNLENYKNGEGVSFVSTKCLNEYKKSRELQMHQLQNNHHNQHNQNKNNNLNLITAPSTGLPWSENLETSPGAVLANELKSNAFKVGRWVAAAQLSGCDTLKLGYAIRNPQLGAGNSQHQLICVQNQPVSQLAAQISLPEGNALGILRHLIDLLRVQPDGEYLFLKDPLKPVVRLYSVPEGALDSETEVEEEEDEDSEDA